jgi:hypothetical protein
MTLSPFLLKTQKNLMFETNSGLNPLTTGQRVIEDILYYNKRLFIFSITVRNRKYNPRQGFSNCGPWACCRWSASTMGKKEESGDVFILERKIIYNDVLKVTNCNQSFLNT